MSLTGSADPAVHPEWLIGLDHPAVAALAGATGATGVGACFGVAERAPDGTPHIAQVFARAGRVAPLAPSRTRTCPAPIRTAGGPLPRRRGTGRPGQPVADRPGRPVGGRPGQPVADRPGGPVSHRMPRRPAPPPTPNRTAQR